LSAISNNIEFQESIQKTKDDVVNTTLFWLAAPTFLALISSALRARETGWETAHSVQAVLWAAATLLYLSRQQFKSGFKSIAIAVMCFIVVTSGYLAHGNTSASGAFILLGTVILAANGGLLRGVIFIALMTASMSGIAIYWIVNMPAVGTNTLIAWSSDIFLYSSVSLIVASSVSWSFAHLGRLSSRLMRELSKAVEMRQEMAARAYRAEELQLRDQGVENSAQVLPCWSGLKRQVWPEISANRNITGFYIHVHEADRLVRSYGSETVSHLLYGMSEKISMQGYHTEYCAEASQGAILLLLPDVHPKFARDTAQELERMLAYNEPPHLNWSTAMFRKWRTENGKQATEAGRDCFEITAS
jgi:hypothetical protein